MLGVLLLSVLAVPEDVLFSYQGNDMYTALKAGNPDQHRQDVDIFTAGAGGTQMLPPTGRPARASGAVQSIISVISFTAICESQAPWYLRRPSRWTVLVCIYQCSMPLRAGSATTPPRRWVFTTAAAPGWKATQLAAVLGDRQLPSLRSAQHRIQWTGLSVSQTVFHCRGSSRRLDYSPGEDPTRRCRANDVPSATFTTRCRSSATFDAFASFRALCHPTTADPTVSSTIG